MISLNDLVDHRKGIDHNNYYRSLYGPHPLEHGFLSTKAFMNYIYISGAVALAFGMLITWQVGLSTLWLVAYLTATRQLGYAMLLVFITVPEFVKMVRVFSKPRPDKAPAGYDPQAWPLYLRSAIPGTFTGEPEW